MALGEAGFVESLGLSVRPLSRSRGHRANIRKQAARESARAAERRRSGDDNPPPRLDEPRLDEPAGDVIVGADGVNSAVRSTGGFESRVSSGSRYARTIV
jgi:2-polyprenyl-6-methoxyphenol hydroxylase-like FAD-dependent oxidoreductase